MGEFIGFAVMAAAGMLLLAFKLGIRRVLWLDIFFDVAITSILMWSLYGTFAGMTVALLAGLMVSVTLLVLKKVLGVEKGRIQRKPDGRRVWKWEREGGVL